MRTYDGYLIVRADGETRVTRRRPKLRWDEVGFPLRIRIPDTWGSVVQPALEVLLPLDAPARPVIGAEVPVRPDEATP